jgi:hypothetical protein
VIPGVTQYRPVLRYPLNSRGRHFVVGDVHGCFSRLDAASLLRALFRVSVFRG